MIKDHFYLKKILNLAPIPSIDSKDSNLSCISSNATDIKLTNKSINPIIIDNFHDQANDYKTNLKIAQSYQENNNNRSYSNNYQCYYNTAGSQDMEEKNLKKNISELLSNSKKQAKLINTTTTPVSSYLNNPNNTYKTKQTLSSTRTSMRFGEGALNIHNIKKKSGRETSINLQKSALKKNQIKSIKSHIKESPNYMHNSQSKQSKSNSINLNKGSTSRSQTPLLIKPHHNLNLLTNPDDHITQRYRFERIHTTPTPPRYYYGADTSGYQHKPNEQKNNKKHSVDNSLKEKIKSRLGFNTNTQKYDRDNYKTQKIGNLSSYGSKPDILKVKTFEKRLNSVGMLLSEKPMINREDDQLFSNFTKNRPPILNDFNLRRNTMNSYGIHNEYPNDNNILMTNKNELKKNKNIFKENRSYDDSISNNLPRKFMNFKSVATLSNDQPQQFALNNKNIINEFSNYNDQLPRRSNSQILNKNALQGNEINSSFKQNQTYTEPSCTFKNNSSFDDPFKFLEMNHNPNKDNARSMSSKSNQSNTSVYDKRKSILKISSNTNSASKKDKTNEIEQREGYSVLKQSKTSFLSEMDNSQDSSKMFSEIPKKVHISSPIVDKADNFFYMLDKKMKARFNSLVITHNDNHKMLKHFIKQMLPQISHDYKEILDDKNCKIYQGKTLPKTKESSSSGKDRGIEYIKHDFGIHYTPTEIYIGLFENNLKTNKGVIYYLKTYEWYIGNWENDKRSGLGSLYYPNSNPKYIGNWYNDKKNGKGILIYEDGKMYEGEFIDDIMEGNGLLRYPNGSPYLSGQWKNNMKDGNFLYTRDGYEQSVRYYENDLEIISNVNNIDKSATKGFLASNSIKSCYNWTNNEETKDTITESIRNSIKKGNSKQSSEQFSKQKDQDKLRSNDVKITCFKEQYSTVYGSHDKINEMWLNNQNINYFMAYLQQMNENEYWDCQHKTQFKYTKIYTFPEYFFTEYLKSPINSTQSTVNKINKSKRKSLKHDSNRKNSDSTKVSTKADDIIVDFYYSNVSYHTIRFICNGNLITDNYERILFPYHSENRYWSLCEINCSNEQNFIFILYDPSRSNSIELSGINEKPLLILYNWLRSEIESRCYEDYFNTDKSIKKYRERLDNSEFKVAVLPLKYREENVNKGYQLAKNYDKSFQNNKKSDKDVNFSHNDYYEENQSENYHNIADSGVIICRIAQCIYEQNEIDFEKEDIENIKDLMKRLYLHDLNDRI